jgi:hypothetical protein
VHAARQSGWLLTATDLQAQGLLAHWGLHAACEAQRTVHVRGVQI